MYGFPTISKYIDNHSWAFAVLECNHQNNISIHTQHHEIQSLRTNDTTIMTAASSLYNRVSTLKLINRVQQVHNCHNLCKITSADGREIYTCYIIKSPSRATRNNHDWPIKSHITVNDSRVWKKILVKPM